MRDRDSALHNKHIRDGPRPGIGDGSEIRAATRSDGLSTPRGAAWEAGNDWRSIRDRLEAQVIGVGVEVERYVVEAEIGSGGTATVWLVRHRMLGSRHAMKVLHVGSAGQLQRLLQEGRIQSRLDHPNLVPVSDVVAIQGGIALVMPYVAGPTLAEWLVAQRPTVEEALALIGGVLDGLEHAHANGVVHRDLKPANILLSPGAGGFVPRITDFGLARGLLSEDEAAVTRSGVGMGTVAYMAPEQARSSRDVDARADLYSLGCVAYELLTGRRAFPQADVLAVTAAAARGEFVPLRTLAPEVPVAVATIVEACLSPDPAGRPASCAAVRDALFAASGVAAGPVPFAAPETAALPAPASTLVLGRSPRRAWPLAALALVVAAAAGAWTWRARAPIAYPFTTGSAVRFDGVSGEVVVSPSASLDIIDAVTIEAWVRPEGWWNGDLFPVIDRVWRIDATVRAIAFAPGRKANTVNLGGPPLGRWTHVALTYDRLARVARWYVDGVATVTEALDLPFQGREDGAPSLTYIGSGPTGAYEYATGCIDDVRVWSRIHDSAEVRAVARGEEVDPAGLVGWWSFDEEGAVARDGSGNGNDGALVGGVTRVASSSVRP